MRKSVVRSDDAPQPAGPYSQAIIADKFIFVAGQLEKHPKSGSMPEGVATQTEQTLKNIESILKAGGSTLDETVRVGVFLQDINDFNEMNRVYQKFFPSNPPARTTVQAGLPGGFWSR